MGIAELLVLAIGLSMDAFAVSVCKGLETKKITIKQMVLAGLWFGGFQALMPAIGYFLGQAFAGAIKNMTIGLHLPCWHLLALICLRKHFLMKARMRGTLTKTAVKYAARIALA